MLGFIKWMIKWPVIIMGLIAASSILITFSPVFFFLSVAAFWYFTLEKPNERYGSYAKRAAAISMISFLILLYILYKEDVLANKEIYIEYVRVSTFYLR